MANKYSNLHGLAPACLPNHSVRNVWRASALGSGEPLGGNNSRSQPLYKRLQNHWKIYDFDATPCKPNEISTILCGTDALSGAGDAHGFHEIIGSRTGQCFQVSVEAFSADGRPGAFEQPHASHHVAHDSDNLGVVETVLAGSHIWHVIRGKRIFVFLDVDESPSDILEEHGALSVESRCTIAEPPLHVASRPRRCMECYASGASVCTRKQNMTGDFLKPF